jgi:hypothetical protein
MTMINSPASMSENRCSLHELVRRQNNLNRIDAPRI